MGRIDRQVKREKKNILKAFTQMNKATADLEKASARSAKQLLDELDLQLRLCGVSEEKRVEIQGGLAVGFGALVEVLGTTMYNHGLLMGNTARDLGFDIEKLKHTMDPRVESLMAAQTTQ